MSVVIDLHMPTMSGFQVMEDLRGRLPVVVITGPDSPEAEMRAFSVGAGAYLRKPVDGQALLDAIHQVISRGPPPAFRRPSR